MMKATEALARLYEQTEPLVGRISPEDLSKPTPCEKWDVRALLGHYVNALEMFPVILAGGQPDWARQVDLTSPAATFAAAVAANLEAWSKPGALEFETPMLPPMRLVDLNLIDALVHPWDLAKGLGQHYQPDRNATLFVLDRWRSAPLERSRKFGAFGPEVELSGSSGPLEELLGMTGRDPSWRPDPRLPAAGG